MVENTNPLTEQPVEELGRRYRMGDVLSCASMFGKNTEDDGAPAAEKAYRQAKENRGQTMDGDPQGVLEPTTLLGSF